MSILLILLQLLVFYKFGFVKIEIFEFGKAFIHLKCSFNKSIGLLD